jgi:hypothetical protein
VARISNEAVINEELEPHLVIAQLKKQIKQLKEEKPEFDADRIITEEERQK